tara:strand:+ start:221 stop:712 length:492 start_codon:yes stop_codon:yes gene_type:complete
MFKTNKITGHLLNSRIFFYMLLLFLWAGCQKKTDNAYDSPYATFSTHQAAIEQNNIELLWETFSTSYKDQQVRSSWRREWQEMDSIERKALLRREITKEQVINDEIAYLLLDSTTLRSDRESPFIYFVKEVSDWKITTHLDSNFHNSLERAIESGQYKLPDQP